METKIIGINDIIKALKLFCINNYDKTNNLTNNLTSNQTRLKNLINNSIIKYKRIIRLIYPELLDQIKFILKTINSYSFGLIFLDWLNRNSKFKKNFLITSTNLKKLLDIVVKNCLCILLLEGTNIYYLINMNK